MYISCLLHNASTSLTLMNTNTLHHNHTRTLTRAHSYHTRGHIHSHTHTRSLGRCMLDINYYYPYQECVIRWFVLYLGHIHRSFYYITENDIVICIYTYKMCVMTYQRI